MNNRPKSNRTKMVVSEFRKLIDKFNIEFGKDIFSFELGIEEYLALKEASIRCNLKFSLPEEEEKNEKSISL